MLLTADRRKCFVPAEFGDIRRTNLFLNIHQFENHVSLFEVKHLDLGLLSHRSQDLGFKRVAHALAATTHLPILLHVRSQSVLLQCLVLICDCVFHSIASAAERSFLYTRSIKSIRASYASGEDPS